MYEDEGEDDAAPTTGKGMPADEFRSLIGRVIAGSVNYADELGTERAEATKYYLGEKFGNEEEGRSQMIVTEVRDGVLAVLPSLLRVFFGPEKMLEFTPRDTSPEALEKAREATDAVQHLFGESNSGFMLSHAVLKDGLVRKLGIFKWGMDVEEREESEVLPGVPPETVAMLEQRPDVTSAAAAPSEQPGLVDVTVTRTIRKKRPWVMAVPPNEFLLNREARDTGEATFVGHRTELTRGELIAMGVPEKFLDEHGGPDSSLSDNEEVIARESAAQSAGLQDEDEAGEANEKIVYVEGYARIDYDGDGIAELRKVCTVGPGYWPIPGMNTPIASAPFSVFCPDPEPHVAIGLSWADRLKDMQLYKSSLLRGASDSLALSLFPRMGYVEGQVSLQDLLNNEIGAPIRLKNANALVPVKHDFMGDAALAMLGYADTIIERRTGRKQGTAGLDAKALQSSTREGVTEVLNSSQEQVELLARIFAEMTLKPLFRGLLQMLVNEHPEPMTAKVQGKLRRVTPGQWDPEMEVSVNVALGTGFLDKRVNDLMLILSKQEQLLTMLGPNNPLVSLPQFRYAIARVMEAKGFRDVDAFFKPIDPNWTPPEPPPPQPTPEQVIAQATLEAERMKTQRELEIKEAELNLKREQTMLEDAREREQFAEKSALERREMELKYQAQLRIAELEHELALRRLESERAIAERDRTHETAIEEERLAQERVLETQKIAAASRAAGEGAE